MAGANSYLSITTLNVSGLNSPIKRHRMDAWIIKTRPSDPLPMRNTILPLKTHID